MKGFFYALLFVVLMLVRFFSATPIEDDAAAQKNKNPSSHNFASLRYEMTILLSTPGAFFKDNSKIPLHRDFISGFQVNTL